MAMRCVLLFLLLYHTILSSSVYCISEQIPYTSHINKSRTLLTLTSTLGTVRVTDVGDGKTYPDHNLGQGEYFGERALITGEPRAANIRAVTNVILMALDRRVGDR